MGRWSARRQLNWPPNSWPSGRSQPLLVTYDLPLAGHSVRAFHGTRRVPTTPIPNDAPGVILPGQPASLGLSTSHKRRRFSSERIRQAKCKNGFWKDSGNVVLSDFSCGSVSWNNLRHVCIPPQDSQDEFSDQGCHSCRPRGTCTSFVGVADLIALQESAYRPAHSKNRILDARTGYVRWIVEQHAMMADLTRQSCRLRMKAR